MAMIPTCDRCGATHVQVVTVLGADLCNLCVADARMFLGTPPVRMGVARKTALSDQAVRTAALRGSVSADEISAVNGEPRRTSYYRLIAMVRSGKLVHRGKGVFVLPGSDRPCGGDGP